MNGTSSIITRIKVNLFANEVVQRAQRPLLVAKKLTFILVMMNEVAFNKQFGHTPQREGGSTYLEVKWYFY